MNFLVWAKLDVVVVTQRRVNSNPLLAPSHSFACVVRDSTFIIGLHISPPYKGRGNELSSVWQPLSHEVRGTKRYLPLHTKAYSAVIPLIVYSTKSWILHTIQRRHSRASTAYVLLEIPTSGPEIGRRLPPYRMTDLNCNDNGKRDGGHSLIDPFNARPLLDRQPRHAPPREAPFSASVTPPVASLTPARVNSISPSGSREETGESTNRCVLLLLYACCCFSFYGDKRTTPASGTTARAIIVADPKQSPYIPQVSPDPSLTAKGRSCGLSHAEREGRGVILRRELISVNDGELASI